MAPRIIILEALSDNYIYLIINDHDAIAVDPAEADPVLTTIAEQDLRLSGILITHHHSDHLGGAAELHRKTGAGIYGPHDSRIPMLTSPLRDGELLECASLSISAMHLPGHTRTHLGFHLPDANWLFTGDTLFCAGCGRLFEGTAEQMWHSLQRITRLPDGTSIFCGHEYTEENLRFALSLEPESKDVAERLAQVKDQRRKGLPSVPSTLALEKRTNPFLRVNALAAKMGMAGASEAEVFAEIRRRKDRF